jgi:DNA-binding beta-propeller fold protein YncE
MALGLDTGHVLEWTLEAGWRIVTGSEASGPNGVAIDADGSTLYLAAYGSQELIRVRRNDGPAVSAVDVPFRPDNITWTPGGRLLVTGQSTSMRQLLGCYALESGSCALPFGVVAVDPETLSADVILEHDGRTVIGAATVALRHAERLYLGTFRGNRAARIEADSRSR